MQTPVGQDFKTLCGAGRKLNAKQSIFPWTKPPEDLTRVTELLSISVALERIHAVLPYKKGSGLKQQKVAKNQRAAYSRTY